MVRNSRFWDGILSQQPTYPLAEKVQCGGFVAIAYKDEECTAEIRSKLSKAAEIVKESNGIFITPVLVDARPRVSGSKVKNAELLRRLHTEG